MCSCCRLCWFTTFLWHTISAPSLCLSLTYAFVCLCVCLSVGRSVCLCVCLPACLSLTLTPFSFLVSDAGLSANPDLAAKDFQSQLVVVCSWRCLKESALLLAHLLQVCSVPNVMCKTQLDLVLLSAAQVQCCRVHYLTVLKLLCALSLQYGLQFAHMYSYYVLGIHESFTVPETPKFLHLPIHLCFLLPPPPHANQA